MTTPNITSGVSEFAKPRAFRPHVVFRFESTLGALSSISTPIFDTVPDGFPHSEVEVSGFSLVRAAGKRFTVYAMITSTIGMRVFIYNVQDNGVRQGLREIYIPSDGGNSWGVFEWESPGRRCQFLLINSPLGASPGTNSNAFFEVVNEAR